MTRRRTHSARFGVLLAAVPWFSACSAKRPSHDVRDAQVDAAQHDAGWYPSPPVAVSCERMDVLFVIDNSDSMKEEQQNLADNAAGFVQTLQNFRGGKVDIRIGVTTTGFPSSPSIAPTGGTAGALLKTPDMKKPWLSSTDAKLAADFKTLATVGTSGSWDEQPLKAMRAALSDRIKDGTNADFLRKDAMLALVLITDEDDSSTLGDDPLQPSAPIPVQDFVHFLDALKGSHFAWTAAVIAGGTAPMCTSRFGKAIFAARLQDFVSQAQGSAVFSSICAGDLSVSLSDALAQFNAACDLL